MAFGLFQDNFPFYGLFRDQWAGLNRAVAGLHEVLAELKDLSERCGEIHDLAAAHARRSKEVLRELSLTMIRPLDRHDVYELNRAFDNTMQALEATATRAGLYGLPAPRGAAREIASNLGVMLREIGGILDQLRTLNHSSLPEERLDDVREETRMLFLVGLGELYEVGTQSVPDLMEIMKWEQIYDRLEETFERTNDIATAVRGIILKNL
jgi:uncharacterized protein Yka (UPF0111/DUF47 family)